MYLWRAHNTVNKRLKGRETEDPKFPKLQFPAPYLCKNCNVGEANENQDRQVEDYLIKFYSNIRPLFDPTEQQLSASADPSTSEFSS
jgi:thiol oxidase